MRTRMTVTELRKIADRQGLRVWCANGNSRRGNPGYMGDVTIARLQNITDDNRKYLGRAIDARRHGLIADERFLTAWRGLISANRRALGYISTLSANNPTA